MKYNCCQVADLCPKNKTCKPFNSASKPWKRFTCECRDGYYGENCDQPIRRSCAGYLDVHRESGKYKVVDSQNSEYEVYCHFDSSGAWTLVQSCSYENVRHHLPEMRKLKVSLSKNLPVNENAQVWDAYRLSKSRMESIKENSTFLQFTCNYKKHGGIDESDYVQIHLQNLKTSGGKNVNVIEFNTEIFSATVSQVRGEIENSDISQCKIKLRQNEQSSLHVHFVFTNPSPPCKFNSGNYHNYGYFGDYHYVDGQNHSCIQFEDSTTQLWFGVRQNL